MSKLVRYAARIRDVKPGTWWKARRSGDAYTCPTEPRQIDRVDHGGKLGAKVYLIGAPRPLSITHLLGSYEPCDGPVAAPVEAPKTNGHAAPTSERAGDYLRVIVREEIARGAERNNGYLRAIIAEEIATALSTLRPALREEALAAVHAAFGQVAS